MASRNQTTASVDDFVAHFRELEFEQQQEVLKSCQDVLTEGVQARLAELDAERARLLSLTGRPDASATQKAGERSGRSRGNAPMKYQSQKEPSLQWSGRGSTPKWLKEEMAETGSDKEAFAIQAAA